MDRINKLCAYLEKCDTFADIGCDHGYCTLYALKNNLCKRATVSDISAKCLEKAEKLLAEYIKAGRVTPVVCNGLQKIDKNTELVLIAGMGGEEIISILKSSFIPENFVLQPMKNARAVREYLICSGAVITADEMFESGNKFYTVIKGGREGTDCIYSEPELDYGKAIKSQPTQNFLKAELNKKQEYLKRPLSAHAKERIEGEINTLRGLLEWN